VAFSYVLYSENLIALPEISCLTENPSVKYWRAMRPMGKIGKGPIVVHGLPEYFANYEALRGKNVYLALIGKEFDGNTLTHLWDLHVTLRERQVYRVPKGHFRQDYIKAHFHYTEHHDMLYYVVPVKKSLPMIYREQEKVSLEVLPVTARDSPQVKILGKLDGKVLVLTASGKHMWDIGGLSGLLFKQYALVFKADLASVVDRGGTLTWEMVSVETFKGPMWQQILWQHSKDMEDVNPDPLQTPLEWYRPLLKRSLVNHFNLGKVSTHENLVDVGACTEEMKKLIEKGNTAHKRRKKN